LVKIQRGGPHLTQGGQWTAPLKPPMPTSRVGTSTGAFSAMY